MGITIRKMLALCMVAVLLMIQVTLCVYAKPSAEEVSDSYLSETLSDWNPDRYTTYVAQYADKSSPVDTIDLDIETAACSDMVQSGKVITVSGKGSAKWRFTAKEAGLYKLRFTYRYLNDSSVNDATLGMQLNGQYPFGDAGSTELHRLWKDQATDHLQDSRGNDIKMTQVQALESITADVLDASGRTRCCQFYLEQGQNTLILFFDDEPLLLEGVTFYNDKVLTYEEYLNGRTPTAGSEAYIGYIQAEEMYRKSDSVLAAARDRTGPATMPSDPVKLRLNVLDGNYYKTIGQKAVWQFSVPENGWYAVGMRVRQSISEGVRVFRRLTIDGELPFAEADCWGFCYDTDWKYYTIGEQTPCYIYLEAGAHTLELEVVPGENGDLVRRLQSLIYVLNQIYRRMIMITGTSPDSFRDYNLHEDIPELLPTFAELADALRDVHDDAVRITGSEGGQISVLAQLETQLREFIEDPITIPNRLSYYSSNVSAVSSLMVLLQSQPLSVDYFMVSGYGVETPDTEASFFASMAYHIQAFFATFFNDYVTLTDEAGATDQEITVWFSGGREQAELLKQIIDNDFSAKKNIKVKMELVQISLSTAYLAGKAPDIVMSVGRGTPVNMASRGVLLDLSSMEGFNEMLTWFPTDATLPYTYRGKCYGLPVSMSFYMLFYRSDVLTELELEVPQTWTDVYNMLAVLQRNNMTFGLPYTTMSSTGTIENGLGAKDIFPSLLMQRGGSVYNAEQTALALDSVEALSAFKEWTELYSQYALDLSYDFYNRFRTGEMPVGITAYSMYNQLASTAPEITGLWDFTQIPGTLKENGTIDRTEAASGTAAVMVKGANVSPAWEFLKWWVGADAQYAFAMETELLMGAASRATPANIEALARLPWNEKQIRALQEQMKWIREIPEVLGGYYTARGIDNAFRNVIFSGDNYREALQEQIISVNDELKRKQQEFAE